MSHAKVLVMVLRRVATILALLTLAVGNVAVCSGWQATAEARMSCCMDGMACSMHKSESQHHASSNGVDQGQADRCCAFAAQRRESPAPNATFASSGMIALVPVAVVDVAPTILTLQESHALVPLRVSSRPIHLLLSVLLV